MDVLTVAEVKALAGEQQAPCLSLFAPMERRGMDLDGNGIRFKNMLREAEEQLVAQGMRQREVDELLEAAWHLHEDQLFWSHQAEGFACFIAPHFIRYFRVPLPFRQQVLVERRFHLRPLLELLSMDGHFYLLAISEHHNRMLYCTRYGAWPMHVSDVPPNMAYTLRFDQREQSIQQHATGTAPGHGRPQETFHGGEQDARLSNTQRYLTEIDKALHRALRDEQAPLVLATVVESYGVYRELSEYEHIAEEFVAGNPDLIADEELHQRGWDIVEPIFARCRQEALGRLDQARAYSKGLTEVEDIVRAAHDGLVDQCFMSTGREVWGAYDPGTRGVAIHETRQPGDEDLLDLAALKVLAAGGFVWAMPPEEMPLHAVAAAVLRYPVPERVVHQS